MGFPRISLPDCKQGLSLGGTEGRDQDVPELLDDVLYDPFKVDTLTIGKMLRQLFCDVCSSTRSVP